MSYKILFVDDTKMFQDIYRAKLIAEGYLVKTADNGVEALKCLSQDSFDLIFLDLIMPVMDGYKVLSAIKADLKLASIPVIVFSSRGQPDEVEKAVSLGASSYLVKATTTPKEVVKRVKSVLGD
jgi:CheY-like chemotaxis protein